MNRTEGEVIKESSSSREQEDYIRARGLEGLGKACSGVSVLVGTRLGGGCGAGVGAGRCGNDPFRVIFPTLP